MTELRFDGQVAIVTGAGGQEPSLGRSHAKLLAERGAKVVVNDLGVGPDGRNVLRANAEQVVEEETTWPHMREAGYGRIVNTTSGAMFGLEHLSIYGAAKGGIFGLTRGLAVEGAALGIKVNALGPAANTSAVRHFNEPSQFTKLMADHFPTSLVSPAVAFLVHESCPVSGANLEAGGGNVGIRVFGQTTGHYDSDLTIEKVRDNFAAIVDTSTARLMPDLADSGEWAPGQGISAPIEVLPKRYQPS